MPTSTRSSSPSAHCRLEWRPSRLAGAALSLLTLAAVASIFASEMPRPVAWPLAAVVVLHGLHLLRRELRRPPRVLVADGAAGRWHLDGAALDDAQLRWRGPLARLAWRDAAGRRHALLWWPDTLPPARRRELRLAASAFPTPPRPGTMAP
ncbi:hypothetical protein LDO26_10280 [Luteimonas sp. BDR2-5]|uniref:protein YgfX n=1 Tax=Proluteimonas luteida TaxID=2878685 RepID=UPI001E408448|nr:protein YgfX [Luteimonas sp. BDR2-5]MCD9028592.1 hypothetical protein [Luteimonas sp. BDR2-5]